MNKKKVVAVSGGFDPYHRGHMEYFKEAKKLGDELLVIINNDNWLKKKKGYAFMPEQDRLAVIQGMKYVDRAVLSEHISNTDDMSVCNELAKYKPDIFANGGDRFSDNIPEKGLCEKLGIEMAFNIGGEKTQSSSWIINNFLESDALFPMENRPWGQFKILYQSDNHKVKKLIINPGESISYQLHKKRHEHWTNVKGNGKVTLEDKNIYLSENESLFVPLGKKHRLENIGQDPLQIIEVQYGSYLGEDDIIRFEDKYKRE